MCVETILKTHYQVITQRLRNPKGSIVESKIVRVPEEKIETPKTPYRRQFLAPLEMSVISKIREAYISGLSIDYICRRFHVSSRTVRHLRQKHGCPLRQRAKRGEIEKSAGT